MLKKSAILVGAILLLGACEQTQTAAPAAPPPPQPTAQTFAVYFDPGKATLSADANAAARQAAGAYKNGGRVTVTGHADTTGSPDFNLQLSQHRAASVKDALVAGGVPAGAITTAGSGEENTPVKTADNVSEKRNRSVDVAVINPVPMSDADYCALLAAKYRGYRTPQSDEEVGRAMNQCSGPGAADAIVVLTKHLTTANVPVPPRM